MKYVVLAILAFSFVSCSSGSKKSKDLKTKESKQKVLEKSKQAEKAAATASAPSNGAIKCEMGSDKRDIAVVTNENGRCEVLYTKNSETSVKGIGNPKSEFCANLAGKIRLNLEGAGFTCK